MRKEIPVVSVCMITYGHENYIRKAVEGVLNQNTVYSFELYILNDCSPDNTDSIIQSLIQKHKNGNKIRYHCNDSNIGAIPNFKRALSECKGEYIALCEGDDYWTDPYKLQKQVDFLRIEKDYVITFHDVTVISIDGAIIKEGRLKNQNQIRTEEDLVGGAHLPTPTVCFRNVIKEYPPEFDLVANGDTFLFSLLGHFGKGYRHLDIQNSYYRVHSGGVWSGKSKIDKLLNSEYTFKNILILSDKKFEAVLFKKLMRINYNIFKNTRSKLNKIKYASKAVRNYMLYLFAK